MNQPLPEYEPEVIEKLVRMGPPPRIFDDAFTARVLGQMKAKGLVRPKKEVFAKKQALENMKFSCLVRILKKKSPKIKLPISLVSVVVKNSKQIENDLLKEKLLQIEGGVKIVTKKGERFVTEFDRAHKAQS